MFMNSALGRALRRGPRRPGRRRAEARGPDPPAPTGSPSAASRRDEKSRLAPISSPRQRSAYAAARPPDPDRVRSGRLLPGADGHE